MAATFRVGLIEARVGERVSGYLEVPGTGVHMPITLIHGATNGPRALVTGGVHGGEYPGIEAAIRLSRELDPSDVSGTVVVVHAVSPPSFFARQQYVVPHDGKNLNRQFPGNALGSVTERMAHTLMTQVVSGMDAWIDLHGGDIHEALVPFIIYSDVADEAVVARSRAMAELYGIRYVLASDSVKGGTYSAAAAAGVPAILAEAGQMGQLDEPSVTTHLKGCRNVLRHLGVLPGAPEPVAPVTRLSEFRWLRAAQAGCWYPAVRIGETVREGQSVGVVRDFFGNILEEYQAPGTGAVLFLVTSLAMNADDPLLAVGLA